MGLITKTVYVFIDHVAEPFAFEMVEEEGGASAGQRAWDIALHGYDARYDGYVRYFPPHRIEEVRVVKGGPVKDSK